MKKAFPALLALLCACLALLVATSSSPLYATNFWTDTNIYFTIGRGMTRGLMPYRDLFDHKGPLLFILYALGAAISDTSFIGVFALEALSLAAAVYAGWRTVRLFGKGRLTLLAMPLLAAAICCCTAFTQGGSAEEFALPALAVGVYLTLAAMTRPEEKTRGRMLGFGAAAGWVFLIKYTDIGLFAGLGVCLLAFVWRREGFGRALLAAGRMLLPAVSDRLGRKPVLYAVYLGLAAGSAWFAFAGQWWVLAAYALLTFFYSGGAAVQPSFNTDLFGLPHAGVNYGFIALGMSGGSILSYIGAQALPLAARHWLAGICAAAGLICVSLVKPVENG